MNISGSSLWAVVPQDVGLAPSVAFVEKNFLVSEMTYTVSSGTLNSTIPYHSI